MNSIKYNINDKFKNKYTFINAFFFFFLDNQVNTNDGYYLSMPNKAQVNNQLPGNDKGSPVALEANKVTVAVCGVTFNNTTNSYRPHYSNMLRIIGGRPTQSGKWPWIVAVLNRFKVFYFYLWH